MTATVPRSGPSAGARRPERPAISLVVPTRNEAANVPPLVARTATAFEQMPWPWELLLVDDSDDDTPDRAGELAADGGPVRVLHRPPGRRPDGLSGAVQDGFAAAHGDVLVVMDADLQHPPEVLPDLVQPLMTGQADVAVASRYCAGAGPDASAGLDGPVRRLVSRACRWPAWAVRPRVRRVRDPLAGFFALRTEVIDGVALRPTGFKILLEILSRGRWRTVTEVPYRFERRAAGSSKAELKQGLVYLRHVGRLVRDRDDVEG